MAGGAEEVVGREGASVGEGAAGVGAGRAAAWVTGVAVGVVGAVPFRLGIFAGIGNLSLAHWQGGCRHYDASLLRYWRIEYASILPMLGVCETCSAIAGLHGTDGCQ